ncbi:MAG: response regulator [Alphaproteobacteria bacterium]|nr:response regulator [Alphaproteobacteria bacterium]
MARLLVIDDNKDVSHMMSEILTREGYEIDTCNDGLKAIEMLQEKKYDLVLSDLFMPQIDGIGLAKFIKKSGMNIPIVILSSSGVTIKASDVSNAIRGMVDGVLEKPAKMNDILSMVESLLEKQKTDA